MADFGSEFEAELIQRNREIAKVRDHVSKLEKRLNDSTLRNDELLQNLAELDAEVNRKGVIITELEGKVEGLEAEVERRSQWEQKVVECEELTQKIVDFEEKLKMAHKDAEDKSAVYAKDLTRLTTMKDQFQAWYEEEQRCHNNTKEELAELDVSAQQSANQLKRRIRELEGELSGCSMADVMHLKSEMQIAQRHEADVVHQLEKCHQKTEKMTEEMKNEQHEYEVQSQLQAAVQSALQRKLEDDEAAINKHHALRAEKMTEEMKNEQNEYEVQIQLQAAVQSALQRKLEDDEAAIKKHHALREKLKQELEATNRQLEIHVGDKKNREKLSSLLEDEVSKLQTALEKEQKTHEHTRTLLEQCELSNHEAAGHSAEQLRRIRSFEEDQGAHRAAKELFDQTELVNEQAAQSQLRRIRELELEVDEHSAKSSTSAAELQLLGAEMLQLKASHQQGEQSAEKQRLDMEHAQQISDAESKSQLRCIRELELEVDGHTAKSSTSAAELQQLGAEMLQLKASHQQSEQTAKKQRLDMEYAQQISDAESKACQLAELASQKKLQNEVAARDELQRILENAIVTENQESKNRAQLLQKVTVLEKDLAEAARERAGLEGMLEQEISSKNSANRSVGHSRHEGLTAEGLQNDLDEKDMILKDAWSQVMDLETQVMDLETEVKRLKSGAHKLNLEKEVVRLKEDGDATVHKWSVQNVQLQGELRKSQEQVTECERRLSAQRSLLDEMRANLAKATKEKNRYMEKKHSLEAQMDTLRKSEASAKQEIVKLRETHQKNSLKIEELSSQVKDAIRRSATSQQLTVFEEIVSSERELRTASQIALEAVRHEMAEMAFKHAQECRVLEEKVHEAESQSKECQEHLDIREVQWREVEAQLRIDVHDAEERIRELEEVS